MDIGYYCLNLALREVNRELVRESSRRCGIPFPGLGSFENGIEARVTPDGSVGFFRGGVLFENGGSLASGKSVAELVGYARDRLLTEENIEALSQDYRKLFSLYQNEGLNMKR